MNRADLLASIDRAVELIAADNRIHATPFPAVSPTLLDAWKADHPGAWDPEVGVRWSDVAREAAKREAAS